MSSKTISAVFEQLCLGLNTDASHHLLELFTSGQHLALVSEAIKVDDYGIGDLEKFKNDYLAYEYLSKYKGLKTGIDTKQVALDSFIAAEKQCAVTNDRIHDYLYRNGSCDWVQIISIAQQKIEMAIGTHPKVIKLLNRSRWGKGSTFSLKGEDARLDYKLREGQISVTRQALQHLRAAMATDYAWLRARGLDVSGPVSLLGSEFKIVPGSRGVTVDKNAKTDRFIAAEPSGNIFLQLGIGGYFRQCLLRVGVNLDDQSINQGLAEKALDLGLATVDLKAASDTIPSALVWLLLPYSWASLLDSVRSPQMYVSGKWHHLSKFSSMGNGYTFELESLIFWSLTEALRDVRGVAGRVSVYGDDIICPSEIVPELEELLGWCGFSFNTKKTHFTGLFRESCGRHFFGGKDVTPIYQKVDPDKNREEFYRCHNRLFYHAVDRGHETSTLVFADKQILGAVRAARSRYDERFSKGSSAHVIPILGHDIRTLEGGLVTDSRSLPLSAREQKGHMPPGMLRCLPCWVFLPKVLKDSHQDALYAVLLRQERGFPTLFLHKNGAEINLSIYRLTAGPFRPNDLYRRSFTGVKFQGKWKLGNEPLDSVLADQLTARRQGRYRSLSRFFPEARDVQWI